MPCSHTLASTVGQALTSVPAASVRLRQLLLPAAASPEAAKAIRAMLGCLRKRMGVYFCCSWVPDRDAGVTYLVGQFGD